ncbi:unnamed protein product, partial [marine sediment metagenome]
MKDLIKEFKQLDKIQLHSMLDKQDIFSINQLLFLVERNLKSLEDDLGVDIVEAKISKGMDSIKSS